MFGADLIESRDLLTNQLAEMIRKMCLLIFARSSLQDDAEGSFVF